MTIKVLDTFAGAGGFSLGFKIAGCDIVGAIEQDKWACETFKFNHSSAKVLKRDINALTDLDIETEFYNLQPDIILGGSPCQGFSICNKKNGDPKDPRNSLFMDFIRIGKVLSPSTMILENVPNIAKAKTQDGKKVIDIIVKELKNLGFYTYVEILDASSYGIPQLRKRLFVIASRKKLENPFPQPTHKLSLDENIFNNRLDDCPTLWDAISDLPSIEAREGSEEMQYTAQAQSVYQELMRKNSSQVFNHVAMKHTKRVVNRFAAMSWGDSTINVPKELLPYERNGKGKISKKIYDQNNRRMHPHKPCHTITASFYANFVHPFKNRNFTAREGARIQSFPDCYVFKGKPTVVSQKLLEREGREAEKYLCQYNQIGNAVPPLLAEKIASNLLRQM